MSEDEKNAKKLAAVLGEAFRVVPALANARGYCPGCFLKAFADAVLAYEREKGLDHVENLTGARVVAEDDTIGETAGNA